MLKKEKLSSLFEITAGGDIKKENYSITKKGKYKYHVYSNQLTEKGLFGFYNNYDVDYDSITVTARGTIGHAETRVNEKYMPIGRLLVLKPKKNINLEYIKNIINSKLKFANESTGVPQLTAPQIGKYYIQITENIKEQQAIADTLTNIDNLIDSLQIVIEKKDKIRNQAMTELLSGKNEKLKTIRLSQIGYAYNGLSGLNSSNFNGGNKRYITFLNILKNPIVKEELFEKFHCDNEQKSVQKGDLFFNTSSETPEEVAMCSTIDYDTKDVYLNSFCFGFRITDKSIDNKYLSYYFRSMYGRNIMKTIAQGSTRFNLPKDKFLNYEIQIPSDINKQKEISEILLKMDKEIEQLNIKLQKYKKIKEGMMEELLTGKVRLNYE